MNYENNIQTVSLFSDALALVLVTNQNWFYPYHLQKQSFRYNNQRIQIGISKIWSNLSNIPIGVLTELRKQEGIWSSGMILA